MKTTTQPILRLMRSNNIIWNACVILALAFLLTIAIANIVQTLNIPTVYLAYTDVRVLKVVAADGKTELPKVLPKGRYYTVWTEQTEVK